MKDMQKTKEKRQLPENLTRKSNGVKIPFKPFVETYTGILETEVAAIQQTGKSIKTFLREKFKSNLRT